MSTGSKSGPKRDPTGEVSRRLLLHLVGPPRRWRLRAAHAVVGASSRCVVWVVLLLRPLGFDWNLDSLVVGSVGISASWWGNGGSVSPPLFQFKVQSPPAGRERVAQGHFSRHLLFSNLSALRRHPCRRSSPLFAVCSRTLCLALLRLLASPPWRFLSSSFFALVRFFSAAPWHVHTSSA